jgi:mitochondrial import inner membrane translocase subunit TIM9
MDLSSFSSAEQAQMNKIIEKRQVSVFFILLVSYIRHKFQMQDFLRMYATITEKCFNTCCNDFTSKSLLSKEVFPAFTAIYHSTEGQEQCVANCTEKFLKHSERIARRFGELNAGTVSHSSPRRFNDVK